MKHRLLGTIVGALCLTAASQAAAQDSTKSEYKPQDRLAQAGQIACADAALQKSARIVPDSGRAIALGRVPGGQVVSTAFLKQGTQPLISYEVAKGADTTDVQVDALTGRVVKAEKIMWTPDQRRARQACTTDAGMGAGAAPKP